MTKAILIRKILDSATSGNSIEAYDAIDAYVLSVNFEPHSIDYVIKTEVVNGVTWHMPAVNLTTFDPNNDIR